MKLLCQMLEVTRSGYYAWRDRPISDRKQRRVQIVEQIHRVFDDSGRPMAARALPRSSRRQA